MNSIKHQNSLDSALPVTHLQHNTYFVFLQHKILNAMDHMHSISMLSFKHKKQLKSYSIRAQALSEEAAYNNTQALLKAWPSIKAPINHWQHWDSPYLKSIAQIASAWENFMSLLEKTKNSSNATDTLNLYEALYNQYIILRDSHALIKLSLNIVEMLAIFEVCVCDTLLEVRFNYLTYHYDFNSNTSTTLLGLYQNLCYHFTLTSKLKQSIQELQTQTNVEERIAIKQYTLKQAQAKYQEACDEIHSTIKALLKSHQNNLTIATDILDFSQTLDENLRQWMNTESIPEQQTIKAKIRSLIEQFTTSNVERQYYTDDSDDNVSVATAGSSASEEEYWNAPLTPSP